ncbi:hypothetical protein [Angustibacter luteus]|uniref:Uncharacterized protein n=1 Tax=Angustibacter luteus TaxID=658456 RepID=A0ABW1JBR7_9ACTN
MTASDGPQREPVGSAADEAARLVDAFQGWWHERAGEPGQPSAEPAAGADGAAGPAGPTAHDPASPCRYCPWCRLVSSAQTVRPEVVQHLLATAESVVGLLRELSRDVSAARTDPAAPDPAAESGPGVRTVTIPVEPDDEPGGH